LPSTVSTLWNNKEAILSALNNNLTTNKKMRKCDLGNADQALLEWFKVHHIQDLSNIKLVFLPPMQPLFCSQWTWA
jgi:hypothetical protein